MRESSSSINEWKVLYDAALQFKEEKCWEWMWDSGLFGVQENRRSINITILYVN